jgi:hypothetical protein
MGEQVAALAGDLYRVARIIGSYASKHHQISPDLLVGTDCGIG